LNVGEPTSRGYNARHLAAFLTAALRIGPYWKDSMKPLQIIAGVAAGLVGAAIWAAISYFANVEVGYVAWGIGILVGIAVAATGDNGVVPGIAAVLITVVAILAGKAGAVEIALMDAQKEFDNTVAGFTADNVEITNEDVQSLLARDLADQREAAGETLAWPNASEDAAGADFFPADVWAAAGRELAAKSPAEVDSIRADFLARTRDNIAIARAEFSNSVRKDGFFGSFGPLDLIFFGLAVFTAWGIVTRGETA
jgi:hypothetical protein